MFEKIKQFVQPVALAAGSSLTACNTYPPCPERIPTPSEQAVWQNSEEAIVHCLKKNVLNTVQTLCAQSLNCSREEQKSNKCPAELPLIKISRLERLFCSGEDIHGDGYSQTYVHCNDGREKIVNRFTSDLMRGQLGGVCIIQVDH
jgi:hypothetical protein